MKEETKLFISFDLNSFSSPFDSRLMNREKIFFFFCLVCGINWINMDKTDELIIEELWKFYWKSLKIL